MSDRPLSRTHECRPRCGPALEMSAASGSGQESGPRLSPTSCFVLFVTIEWITHPQASSLYSARSDDTCIRATLSKGALTEPAGNVGQALARPQVRSQGAQELHLSPTVTNLHVHGVLRGHPTLPIPCPAPYPCVKSLERQELPPISCVASDKPLPAYSAWKGSGGRVG